MAVTPKCVIQNLQLPNATATQYTATGVRFIIDKCTLCNSTGAVHPATIDIGGAGVAYRVLSARSIAAGETYLCPEVVGQIIEVGGTFNSFSDTASAITLRVSGREVT